MFHKNMAHGEIFVTVGILGKLARQMLSLTCAKGGEVCKVGEVRQVVQRWDWPQRGVPNHHQATYTCHLYQHKIDIKCIYLPGRTDEGSFRRVALEIQATAFGDPVRKYLEQSPAI